MDSLRSNKTWVFVTTPMMQKVADCKCIYKVKGSLTSFENVRISDRLAVKGFVQVE